MAVPQLTFYVDFISPYAYLAFERLPQALQGVSHAVRYQPILFGSLLQHHGTIGPAELAPKRAWTYRHVSWLAQAQGTPMQMPVSHPFNPLPLLRLALACGGERAPNRWVCETIFRHVWAEGGEITAQKRHRIGSGCWGLWRAHGGRGRQAVLGPGCLAHASRPPRWRRLVLGLGLGRCGPGAGRPCAPALGRRFGTVLFAAPIKNAHRSGRLKRQAIVQTA
jgi:hypothetical protein